ncbi:MAG: hypothetical protein KJS98_07530, partial [Nitrospirae bacterium]|nr:hypothetical protein [Nitrospirota bacterium]
MKINSANPGATNNTERRIHGDDPKSRVGETHRWLRVLATVISLASLPSLAFAASSAINLAAERLNTILPPPMLQQTIVIGTYDAATQTFTWILPEGYLPGTPEYKKAENGGPVHPQHFAFINSYNIRYRFNVINAPPSFRLTLRVADARGRPVDVVAVLDNTGASVSF